MSVNKWDYGPEKCDGDYCPGVCDKCQKSGAETRQDDVQKLDIQNCATFLLTVNDDYNNIEKR